MGWLWWPFVHPIATQPAAAGRAMQIAKQSATHAAAKIFVIVGLASFASLRASAHQSPRKALVDDAIQDGPGLIVSAEVVGDDDGLAQVRPLTSQQDDYAVGFTGEPGLAPDAPDFDPVELLGKRTLRVAHHRSNASGWSRTLRRQAARHSSLDMCVSASQLSMHNDSFCRSVLRSFATGWVSDGGAPLSRAGFSVGPVSGAG